MQRKSLVAGDISFLNNVIRVYLLIFLFVFSIVTTSFITETISADSNSYYVSTTGNNGNNGLSPQNAWKTIEYAVTKVSSGGTINIMAGTYKPINHIAIINKNTVGQWFTIQNYNDDRVIIDGTNCPITNEFNGTIELKNSKYIHITGLTINHSATCGISLKRAEGTVAFVKIDNCTISNCSASAMKVMNGHNNIIFEYNYVYDNFQNWSSSYSTQETLSFENVATFSINHNTIINNHAENIDMKGGCKYGSVCYNAINNTGGYLHKIAQTYYGGPAIMLDARGVSHDISIYNNKIYGNASGISLNTETTGHYEYIYIYNNMINLTKNGAVTGMTTPEPLVLSKTGSSTDTFHHIYIYSNTVHTGATNNYAAISIGDYRENQLNSGNVHDLYLVNNIFVTDYTGSSNAISGHFLLPTDIVFNNNCYYRTSGTLRCRWNQNFYTNQTEWTFGNDAIFSDPLFVNEATGNFHLSSTSSCIDTGNNTIVPSFDFDGVSRPQGPAIDRGAFEFPSEDDTTPPQISAMSIITSNPLDTDPLYGWVNVSCTVTDNVAVSQVILRIHNSGGSWNNVSMMTRTSGKYYYRSTTAFSIAGNYTYSIWAKDSSNNAVTSTTKIFSMSPNWDIRIDDRCTVFDLVFVAIHWGQSGANGWIREDADNNGIITILDLSLVSNHFGEQWYT